MIDPEQVRRIALALEGTLDQSKPDRLAFSKAGQKASYAWTWLERARPRKPRVPRLEVLAVRCPIGRKEILLEVAPDLYFDDDHYRGYPAILVRLDAISEDELVALLKDAWRL